MLIDSEGFGLSPNIANYFTYGAFLQNGTQTGTIVAGGPLGDPYHAGINACGLRRLIANPIATLIVGFRGAFNSEPGTNSVYFSDASGVELFELRVSATGQLRIYAGDGNTLLGGPTPAGTVPTTALGSYYNGTTPFAWSYVEVMGTISTTAGAVTVRVNGTTVLSLTNKNTNINAGTPLIGLIDWGVNTGYADIPNGLAHIYICDTTGPAPWNTFLGDVRVQTLLPTANDAVQFTPHGLATNWGNEALATPIPGTDYNLSSTVGQQDTFTMAPAAASFGTVFGVHVKTLQAKSNSGARSGANVLKSGTTTVVGATRPLTVTPTQYKDIYQTDPNTSAAWTLAAASAIKPGYKLVA